MERVEVLSFIVYGLKKGKYCMTPQGVNSHIKFVASFKPFVLYSIWQCSVLFWNFITAHRGALNTNKITKQ